MTKPSDSPTPPAPKKPRAQHGSRNGPKGAPPAPAEHPALPAFEPVPRKFRHDGWTPARQKAFIGALADTGCVSRAARYVNMSPEGAYWLRRQKGSEGFRRAWEAALDLGVQRLKDELFDRALTGQLQPVFMGGKLKGFKRVKNDRLLMFALRMNARDEYGRRMAATYFDPNAPRLHGGSGPSSSNEVVGRQVTSSSSEALGQQRINSSSAALGNQKLTITGPAVSRARRDDRNAAIIANFDPAEMSLREIEAMQAMLHEAAARHRAEEDGPPEHDLRPAFIANRNEDEFKPCGPLEDIYPVVLEEDREDEFDPDEVPWWELGGDEG